MGSGRRSLNLRAIVAGQPGRSRYVNRSPPRARATATGLTLAAADAVNAPLSWWVVARPLHEASSRISVTPSRRKGRVAPGMRGGGGRLAIRSGRLRNRKKIWPDRETLADPSGSTPIPKANRPEVSGSRAVLFHTLGWAGTVVERIVDARFNRKQPKSLWLRPRLGFSSVKRRMLGLCGVVSPRS